MDAVAVYGAVWVMVHRLPAGPRRGGVAHPRRVRPWL